VNAWAALRRSAWIAWVAHAAAGLTMLLVLRHGLDTNPDVASRMRFVTEQRAGWTLAWLPWNSAAVSILYFCVTFAAAHRLSPFAVALCSAAIACDLGAESILMGLLPELAGDQGKFLVWQRAAVLLTGYVANGLYTAAIAALLVPTRGAYPPAAVATGGIVVASGIALSGAALAGSVRGLFWTNAVLLPALLLWLLFVARDAQRRSTA
jgi:hypothetical protein